MMWVRFLATCRPFWQFSILLLYSFFVTSTWDKSLVATVGAAFIGFNFILGWRVDHPSWKTTLRRAIAAEAIVAVIASVVLTEAWPIGPACLLILPSLVSYAWMFERDLWAYAMAATPWGVLVLISGPALFGPTSAEWVQPDARIVTDLVWALYAAICAFGSALAFLVQRQRRESRELADLIGVSKVQAAELQRLNQQTSEYANQVYDLATAEERNRIAGEIHDTVAHRLTALIVQLQGAKRFLREDAGVLDATSNLEVCEALAREALDEVRMSVRRIRRPSNVDGLDVLHRLARNYGSLTHMDIGVDIASDIAPLSAKLVASLHRVMEESLTNAQRHGRATRVQITMAQSGGWLGLQIDDNGRGTNQIQYGFGLSSMRDRLRSMGADLQIDSSPGSGFSVRIKIPMVDGAVES